MFNIIDGEYVAGMKSVIENEEELCEELAEFVRAKHLTLPQIRELFEETLTMIERRNVFI